MGMTTKRYSFDECCLSLAQHFLADSGASQTQLMDLAQAFQETAEDFLRDIEDGEVIGV
jgi:hypothetical protein